MKRVTPIFIFLLLFLAAYAHAATYWVSKSGSNGNGCNNSSTALTTTAKLTVAAGLSCLSSGDTLNIRTGTYTEDINSSNFSTSKSGTGSGNNYTNPTTIQ